MYRSYIRHVLQQERLSFLNNVTVKGLHTKHTVIETSLKMLQELITDLISTNRELKKRDIEKQTKLDELESQMKLMSEGKFIVFGPKSEALDDAQSKAVCPHGSILHQCDCVPFRYCDGSWFTSMTTCTAYSNYKASGVQAKASCVWSGSNYTDVERTYSHSPFVSCPDGTTLVGCTAHTAYQQKANQTMEGNRCSIEQTRTRIKVRCRVG